MSPRPQDQPDLALSRHALVAEAFERLAQGLGPFIDAKMAEYFSDEPSWAEAAANRLGRPAEHGATDPLFQLLVLRRFWGPVFGDFFGEDLRGLIGELIDVRNQWAHFRLPDDSQTLQRSILSIERLLAPVQPELTAILRKLRSRVASPASTDSVEETVDVEAQEALAVDIASLEAQLSETESVFQDLQDRYGNLESELRDTRQVTARKQVRLAALEQRLVEIEGRSLAAESFLVEERSTRYRIEWLFVGLLATLLLFMVLANT